MHIKYMNAGSITIVRANSVSRKVNLSFKTTKNRTQIFIKKYVCNHEVITS